MFLEVRACARRVLVMQRVTVARRERLELPEQVPRERACMRVRARARVRVRVGNGFR